MTILIALLLVPFLVPTALFVVEILAGLKGAFARPDRTAGMARTTIVVPAHDEEAGLRETLAALKAVDGGCSILVVADNCTDGTAEIARESGVNVIERNDAVRRGKGFALDFAAQHLDADPPEVVVVHDADCWMDSRSLALLVAAAAAGRPAQAVYLMLADPRAPAKVQISSFAFLVKNLVRQRGLQRLAGRVHLTGTGMAFPFPLFRKARLASDNIVEDLALGLDLARDGHPPILVEEATVWSRASGEAATFAQRQRWEGGFLGMMMTHGPALVREGWARRRLGDMLAGLDLMVPPLALLFLIDMSAILLASLITLLVGAAWWPIIALAAAMAISAVAVLVVWVRHGRAYLKGRTLLRLPLYMVWKVPMYLGFAKRGRPQTWNRTER